VVNRYRSPRKKKNAQAFPVAKKTALLEFLFTRLKNTSRRRIKSLLGNGQVSVDGKIVRQFDHLLMPGARVAIDSEKAATDRRLTIVYQDEDIIVIDKPAGLLSIATENEKEETAYHLLRDHVKKSDSRHMIFVVHRLDRDTSGLLLFARGETVKKRLQESWHDIVKERTYVAVAQGILEKSEGTVTSYLRESKTLVMRSDQNPAGGRKAVTRYRLLKHNARYSLVEINLETGRKNQIRIHFQTMGHSIVGDKKYGANVDPLGRLGLHARVLSFIHPTTGQLLRFETDIPPSFLELVAR
jgi:23S rRNA pseudouridine1911/1915/1917 synthase